MSSQDTAWARVPQGQNILALRHARTHLLALWHPGRQAFGLVAPRRVLGTGLVGHTGQNSGLRPFGMGILIGSQPVQGDGGRPGLPRRAELLAGERLIILAEVPGGELAE